MTKRSNPQRDYFFTLVLAAMGVVISLTAVRLEGLIFFEAYRVDLCDQCKGYIKTVDSRKLDYEPDLSLEDIVTIHLDIHALKKGYKRPVPTSWGPMVVVE